MKYEVEWLLECLQIRIKSPAVYEHLRMNNILPLPCKDTLRKLTTGLCTEFGFNEFALECIKNDLKNKSLPERYGSLMWDEMSITQDIHFGKHTFQFKGFTYLCEDEEQQEPDFSALNYEWSENEDCTEASPRTTDIPDLADHALVLVFRPYKARWIQPIALFATKNAASGSQLYKIVLKAMILIEEANARLLTTVCDGSQSNNAMWNLCGISGSNTDTSTIKNSMTHPTSGSDVYFLRDVPHLFKWIRNHIFNHNEVQVRVTTIVGVE